MEKLLAVLKKPTISACAYKTHMIGRFNDVAKLKKANYKSHPQYEFLLTSRLPWSKNMREMQQSPWQAIVAEDDWEFDKHLLMAKYLEVACERRSFVRSRFVFVEQGDASDNLKDGVRRHLKENVIDTPHFKAI